MKIKQPINVCIDLTFFNDNGHSVQIILFRIDTLMPLLINIALGNLCSTQIVLQITQLVQPLYFQKLMNMTLNINSI